MNITFRKEHYREIRIDSGDVYEEFDVNIEEHWNNSISNRKPDVYKSFSELNTETKYNGTGFIRYVRMIDN